MTSPIPNMMTVDEAVVAVRALASGGRRILGLVGSPGAGKSTLSDALMAELGPAAVIVPMDGFHLANGVLESEGTRLRKGAPETFDADGYVSLLARIRTQQPGDPPIYAPRYDRGAGASIGGSITVSGDTPLVITEGNYLLLDSGGWPAARPLLDACWFIHVDDAIRVPRLIQRHVDFGKSPAEAEEWVMRSDEANAALVKASAQFADAAVDVG